MGTLSPETYNFHFRNLLEAPGRNSTYICFEVKNRKRNYRGFLQNKGGPEEPLHAEDRFWNWFHDNFLDVSPDKKYKVTWYVSWSPCYKCAEKMAGVLEAHKNVSLRIFVSRLYCSDNKDERQGLRRLVRAGAALDIMAPEDFEYCWDNFVERRGSAFTYWKGIRRNYYTLVDKLNEILWE